MRGLVRQLSIDQFENESRRVSMGVTASEPGSVARKTPIFTRSFSEPVSAPACLLWVGGGVKRRYCTVLPQASLPQREDPLVPAPDLLALLARLHLLSLVCISTSLLCPLCQGIHKLVLREFLNPRHWRPPENRDFLFNFDQICQLCDQAEKLFQREPSVLRLRGGWRREGVREGFQE